MSRRSISLLLDALMLAAFSALQSWRFTGVPAHEWLALALLAVLLVHLVLQWDWVETRVVQLWRRGTGRTRVNVALNTLLFVAMGSVLVSGVAISKIVLPHALTPGRYLAWHRVHELASNVTLLLIGLHVAINVDLIASGVRRLRRRWTTPTATPKAAPSVPRAPLGDVPVAGLTLGEVARRALLVLVASALLTVVVQQLALRMPAEDRVMRVGPDGARSMVPVPPEMTVLRPGTEQSHLVEGAPRFVVQLLLIGVIALVGRKALRLRLS